MESMDNFRERIEALEQRTEQLKHETQALARQARWWRGIACGVGLLGLVSLSLQSGTAADTQPRGMTERMATLENKLSAMTFDGATNEVVITGANLRIVNGLGATKTTNGLGNLIVGYNESRQGNPDCLPGLVLCTDTRTGSHNVIVGAQHNFSSFGGLVAGFINEISGEYASVSGGSFNTASGLRASVSGGYINTASGFFSSVSSGINNTASGDHASSVSGGYGNTASGFTSSVSGGGFNTASEELASVSGGFGNTASGLRASVSGGVRNTASGDDSSVSGGFQNTASGIQSSVSGGANRTAPGTDDWTAGPLFADN
jgi:hypothetical protein